MRNLERWAPPGMDLGQWKTFLRAALIVCCLTSFCVFGSRLLNIRSALFDAYTGELIKPVGGWYFGDVLSKAMLPFLLFAAGMAAFVVLNYLYFFEGSKSIYTMARVKSFWELHIRCWTLPVLGAGVLLLCRVALTVVYFLIFLLATPKGAPLPQFYHLIGGLLS